MNKRHVLPEQVHCLVWTEDPVSRKCQDGTVSIITTGRLPGRCRPQRNGFQPTLLIQLDGRYRSLTDCCPVPWYSPLDPPEWTPFILTL